MTEEALIEKLIKSKVAVFCGAGISFNSGMPIVGNIIKSILTNMEVDSKDIKTILTKQFPFEKFIEDIFVENTELESFLSIFKLGLPNLNHYLISILARENIIREIYTTNFDLLIERALVKHKIDFTSFCTEDDFKNIKSIQNSNLPVIKVHGSADNFDSIRTTIEKIANKNLTKERFSIIKYLFESDSTDVILFFGYSCSDFLDITPHIQAIHNAKKEIIFIDHSSENKVEKISIKSFKNPFKNHIGHRIYCNTDSFVNKIFSLISNPINIDKTSINWENYINSIFIQWDKRKFNGRLTKFFYSTLFDTDLAIKYNNRNYNHLNSTLLFDYTYLLNNAILLENKNNIQEALFNLVKCKKILANKNFPKEHLHRSKASVGNLEVIIHSRNNDYTSAIEAAKKTIHYLNEHEIKHPIENALLLQLSNAYNFNLEHKEALKIQIQALRKTRNEGDLYSQLGLMIGMSTSLYELNKLRFANCFIERALQLSMESGNLNLQEICLNSKAVYLIVNEQYSESLIILEKLVQTSRYCDDKSSECIALSNIAEVYMRLNNFPKALEYTNLSNLLCYEIKDNVGILKNLKRQIIIEIDFFKDFQSAFSNGLKCLDLITISNVPTERISIRDIYFNISLSAFKTSNNKIALEYINKATEIDIELNEKNNLKLDNALVLKIKANG